MVIGLLGIVFLYSPPHVLADLSTEKTVKRIEDGLASSEVASIADLAGRLRAQQRMFLFVMPPGGGLTLKQACGMAVFDPKAFPAAFNSGLIGEKSYDSPVYTIILAEDPVTHETVIANADGREIASVPPEAGYNPWWCLDLKYPDLYSGGYSEASIRRLQDEYNPARIQITLTLLPADYVKTYAKAVADEQAALAAEQAALALKSPKSKLSGGMMMMYQDTGMTNFLMGVAQVTNGMKVVFAYPDDYTNRVDFFTCPNLAGNWWDLAVSATNINTSTNFIEWVDVNTAAPGARFYNAGNADLDTDSDGIPDVREKFLYHTDPENPDSDGDGLNDYYEVFTSHTDPNNNDTNKPNVWISFPAEGTVEVWEP